MTGREYQQANDYFLHRFLTTKMSYLLYTKYRELLDCLFDESQQEKPSENRSVDRAGTEAGG